jgi:hypothetical protein
MNVVNLLEKAQANLQQQDSVYHEQADTLLGMLRSAGVLSHKRASVNGKLHKLISAMIVEAFYGETTIDVATRRQQTYHLYGFSTETVKYLDRMVETGFLLTPLGKAKGALTLSPLLHDYLEQLA